MIQTFVPDKQKSRRAGGVSDGYIAEAFVHDPEADRLQCPRGHRLQRRKLNAGKTAVTYQAKAKDCQARSSKPECCPGSQGGRYVNRPLYEKELKEISDRVHSPVGRYYRRARSVVVEGGAG